MQNKTSKYASVAVIAADAAMSGLHPVKAWESAAFKIFPDSEANRKKGCPKSAFLGLAEAGQILGILPGTYTRSEDNKRYALAALKLLLHDESYAANPKRLWLRVMELEGVEKIHNCQMDVVTSLWHAQKFVCQSQGSKRA